MLNTQFEKHDRPAQNDHHRMVSHRDICLYFECPKVDSVYEYLTSNGISLEPPVNREYGMRQLYVDDPDGDGLCFQCPID